MRFVTCPISASAHVSHSRGPTWFRQTTCYSSSVFPSTDTFVPLPMVTLSLTSPFPSFGSWSVRECIHPMWVHLHGPLKSDETRWVIARCSPRFDVFAIRRIWSPRSPSGAAPEALGVGSSDVFLSRGPNWVPPNNFVSALVFPSPEP